MKKNNSIFNYFVRGLSVLVPFAVTLYVAWKAIEITNRYVCSFAELIPYIDWTVEVPGLSLFITLIAITIFGYLGTTFIFAPLINFMEYIIMNIPLLNILYSYTKESTFGFIDKLNQPVIVKIPFQGAFIQKIGFLTQEKMEALSLKDDEVAVYLPHSYAFSGELSIFPRSQVTPINLSATETMKLILTGGLAEVTPLIEASDEEK